MIMATDTRKFYMDELEIREYSSISSFRGPYTSYSYNIGRNNYYIRIYKTGEAFGMMYISSNMKVSTKEIEKNATELETDVLKLIIDHRNFIYQGS